MLLTPLSPAAASDNEDDRYPHIRITDRRMQRLLDEGVLRSPKLSALVERISRSDVVVYVWCDGDPRSECRDA